MKIKGVQELTLIDYPEKIACTIFLYGCNLRCGFCHNPELVLKDELPDVSKEDVLKFLEKRTRQLEGVCFTGGEPLMTLEIDFLQQIKDMGYKIKLDTNGCFPERLQGLIERGLVDYVAMDIKSSPEHYADLTEMIVDITKIERSIKLIVENMKDYEFRTTIIQDVHTQEEVKKMVEWILQVAGRKPKLIALQGFKNQGKFVDKFFKKVDDTSELHLRELRYQIKGDFEKVEIRV
jgi:anaerobic ribonucleoside-triphosphate reductase activating protein